MSAPFPAPVPLHPEANAPLSRVILRKVLDPDVLEEVVPQPVISPVAAAMMWEHFAGGGIPVDDTGKVTLAVPSQHVFGIVEGQANRGGVGIPVHHLVTYFIRTRSVCVLLTTSPVQWHIDCPELRGVSQHGTPNAACVTVLDSSNTTRVFIVSTRNIKRGDKVVLGGHPDMAPP